MKQCAQKSEGRWKAGHRDCPLRREEGGIIAMQQGNVTVSPGEPTRSVSAGRGEEGSGGKEVHPAHHAGDETHSPGLEEPAMSLGFSGREAEEK